MSKLLSKIVNGVMKLAQGTGNVEIGGDCTVNEALAPVARLAAAEGAVLLKNTGGVLPFSKETVVSVFGRSQINYFYVGYGSGGDVNATEKVSLLTGLRACKGLTLNEKLAAVYEGWCAANVPDEGFWGHWPKSYPEMPVTEALAAEARANSDAAVIVLGRSSGEDSENTLTKGSFYLAAEEVNLLRAVTAAFDKVVLLLNVGSLIDMSVISTFGDKISAIMYVWQGGMESGHAVADLLCGAVNPSGKLADTIAKCYADYPSGNFGNALFNNYTEDIFVGYRYFETLKPNAVLYPFGYGLSYTTFRIEATDFSSADGTIAFYASVTNIGKRAGKETVQVYYSAPQGKLGKSTRTLAVFAKTALLQPGETEKIKFSFPIAQMASYDDGGFTGEKSAYVLEAGAYEIFVGNSVRADLSVGVYTQNALTVTKQLTEASAVQEKSLFERLTVRENADGTLSEVLSPVPIATRSLHDLIAARLPKPIAETGDKGIKLSDVAEGKATLDAFIAQLSATELEAISRGDYIMNSPLGATGNAGVFGGVLSSLRDKGVLPITTTDGPSGIRLRCYASLLPVGTALACSWNMPLLTQLYSLVADEMKAKGSDVLLCPGMNIHRNPLCGRNFEYFSEDPLLSGRIAGAVVRGIQANGLSACPKHFACNNQEANRNNNDSRLSERALREIYLKGFEICVAEAEPKNIMTSYNKINGVWGHYNYELCNVILRDEWGFKGNVMTDWWMRSSKDPDFPKLRDNGYRIRAGVNVLMPGGGRTGRKTPDTYLLKTLDKADCITLAELQQNAAHVLRLVLDLKYSVR